MSASKKKLVILGAGMGGLALALAIEADKKLSSSLDVVLVDKKEYYEVTLAAVRFLVDAGTHGSFTKPIGSYLKKTKVVCGEVRTVHAQPEQVEVATQAGVEDIPYEFLVISLGTRYPFFKAEAPALAGRTEEVTAFATQIRNAHHILIVGGRAVGLEVLGEILTLHPDKQITLVHSGDHLMDEWPKGGIAKVTKFAAKHANVRVVVGTKVVGSEGNRHELSDGSFVEADMKISATGVVPNSEPLRQFFAPSLTPNGYVKVLGTLQLEGYNNIFAIGDIAEQAAKLAANLKNHIKAIKANLHALLQNKPTKPAPPPMMNYAGLVSLGPSYAILALPVFGGSSMGAKFLSGMKTDMWTKCAQNGAV